MGSKIITFLCLLLVLPLQAREGPAVPRIAVWNGDSLRVNVPADPWLAPDKARHFAGSMMLTVFTAKSGERFFNQNTASSRRIAVGLTFSLGVIKELADGAQRKNRFSWKDLAADAAGILAGIIILEIE